MTEDIQSQLDLALAVDAENARKARDFQPRPRIVAYKAGEFLVHEGTEVPRAFIVDITHNVGKKPYKWFVSGFGCISEYVVEDSSIITIHLASGHTVTIPTNRHCIDILLAALRHAWKHGVSVVDHSYVEAS